MGKVCGKCKEEKNESCFHVNQDWCKTCKSDHMKNLYRTSRKYYLNNRYNVLKQRAEGRSIYPTGAKGLPFCTRKEFLNWCKETEEIFNSMWKTWQESSYDLTKAPSVDRIDSKKGYEIGNLQWLIFTDNCSKGDKSPFDYASYTASD